jgi:hypothetical protein
MSVHCRVTVMFLTVITGVLALSLPPAAAAVRSSRAVGISSRAVGINHSGGTTTPSSQLLAVSCTADTACTAVGSYTTSSGLQSALVERWNGTKWTVQKTLPASNVIFELAGVSCSSATSCMAVGGLTNSETDDTGTLALSWNGTKWTEILPPNPPGSNQFASLSAVSCSSAASCTAVGTTDNSGPYTTLVERWNGSKWAIQKSVDPSGSIDVLDGVSCVSASACTAVGGSATGTLVEQWNGTKWSVVKSPNPKGATGELLGVSCLTTSTCVAAGDASSGEDIFTLAETWNGKTWKITKTPNASGSVSSLKGVSCSAAGACTAVGGSSVGTLAERLNGTVWVTEKTPNPAKTSPSNPPVLHGAVCFVTPSCVAVGASTSATTSIPPPASLAEGWNGTAWKIQATPNP